MNPPALAAALALSAAAAWGSGDFTGGLSARRVGPFHTVLISYAVGLVALTAAALGRFERFPLSLDLAWGALAGLSGTLGIGSLFRGFAAGRMGIVAPVSGVLATAIPVVFSALTEGLPRNIQLLGFALAPVGIWLLSRRGRPDGGPSGLGAALLAGLGFGGFFVGIAQIGEGSVFWPLVAGRATACALMVAVALSTHRPLIPRGSPVALLILAGLLDVGGNLFFLLATQSGRLDVAAVLGSLYPAVTVILARLIVREHMTLPQVIGVAVSVVAIALISI